MGEKKVFEVIFSIFHICKIRTEISNSIINQDNQTCRLSLSRLTILENVWQVTWQMMLIVALGFVLIECILRKWTSDKKHQVISYEIHLEFKMDLFKTTLERIRINLKGQGCQNEICTIVPKIKNFSQDKNTLAHITTACQHCLQVLDKNP